MSLEITFIGHSAFLLSDGTHTLAIDPFLTGNPVTTMKASDVVCTHVALTHGHSDHFGDTIEIAARNKATVIAAYEITEFCGEHGIDNIEPANPGGRVETDFGWVAFTHAFHSSSYEGRYMGMPCGIVAHMGGATVYHLGDTGLFGDLKLIGDLYKPDVALVPVGDRFTMGPEHGRLAAEMVRPKVAVPIHYKTWPLLVSDIDAFTPDGVEVKVMEPGETWKYG